MHKYRFKYVTANSQHANATLTPGEAIVEAVSAQDAAYILSVNLAGGKRFFLTIISVEHLS